MKKFFKILSYILLVILVLIFSLLVYVKTALPNVGSAADLKIEYTKERVERGKYLANYVSVCMDCHSTRDWSKFSGPIKEGTLGEGGERFDQSVGFPGVYYSRNITPAGIARYTDGELYRLITTGVTKEGRAMFPVMPYAHYGRMDPEDIKSIISYVRSIQPIQNMVPESVSDFPMNFILNTIPKKAEPQKIPPASDQLGYGEYMANATGCIECHTPFDKGQIIQSKAFGGGREFRMPGGILIRSGNITPDDLTGIGKWTEDVFVGRFKIYADSNYKPQSVGPGEFNSVMPWLMYSKMNREDLAAIFAYLKSVKPISNKVIKFSQAPKK